VFALPKPHSDTGAADNSCLHVRSADFTESYGKLMLRLAINTIKYANDAANYSNYVRQCIQNSVKFQCGHLKYSATEYEPKKTTRPYVVTILHRICPGYGTDSPEISWRCLSSDFLCLVPW
jgi:hypothetical protein